MVMEVATPEERESVMEIFRNKFIRNVDDLNRIPQPRRGRIASKIIELIDNAPSKPGGKNAGSKNR